MQNREKRERLSECKLKKMKFIRKKERKKRKNCKQKSFFLMTPKRSDINFFFFLFIIVRVIKLVCFCWLLLLLCMYIRKKLTFVKPFFSLKGLKMHCKKRSISFSSCILYMYVKIVQLDLFLLYYNMIGISLPLYKMFKREPSF